MKLTRKIVSCLCAMTLSCTMAPAAYADEARESPDIGVEAKSSDSQAVIDEEPAKELETPLGATVELPSEERNAALSKTDEASREELGPTSGITDGDIAEVLEAFSSSASEDSGIALLSERGASVQAELKVDSIYGETQYDTAAQEALYAYASSATVIVASGESYVDALSATSLAGALDCPILLTARDSVPSATAKALKTLGAANVIVVGGTGVVSDATARALGCTERLWGVEATDTQLKIYEYGRSRSLWDPQGRVIVATGSVAPGCFADALSASPIAFKSKIPVFITSESGELPSASTVALMTGGFKQAIIAGGTGVVPDVTAGVLKAATIASTGTANVVRKYGETLYDTSAALATWAVEQGLLRWDGAAFATGWAPYDALAGSVVQGKSGSVLLIVGENKTAAVAALSASNASMSNIKFLGGPGVISQSLRTYIVGCLTGTISYEKTGVSLSKMAILENRDVSVFDPNQWGYEDSEFYQFAVLNKGYSGMVTADQINAFIDKNCVYQEENYGVRSKLRGTGAYFIAAAQASGVNEVYLLTHAILESAWGCSKFAQGSVAGYEGYYNLFGIHAFDSDPNQAAIYAKEQEWSSVQAAISGGANWIAQNSSNYLNNEYHQNTLYKMRWNYEQAAREGKVWKQYATSNTWATGIANIMANFYSYVGIDKSSTGLVFAVPLYS